jgi:hypothetical protein
MIQTMLLIALLAQHPAAGEGRAVAQLKWEQENVPTFVRGTVPAPRDETMGRWVLIDQGGDPHPAQLEEVVRDPEGRALVYEVIARLPAAKQREQSGTLARTPGTTPTASLPPAHEALPSGLRFSARDANGSSYQATISTKDPSHQQLSTLKNGPIHREDKHALVMLPSAEAKAKGAQPHLFGIHAYLGRWEGAGFLTLDLRVHNALIGTEPTESPIGPLYFESLKLSLPKGWTALAAVNDPHLRLQESRDGESALIIVDELRGQDKDDRARLQMMPPGASLHRRLVLFPKGDATTRAEARAHLAGEGWAVCSPKDGLYSWSNPKTSHYFPQRELLPNLGAISAPVGKQDSSLLSRLKLADEAHAQQIATGAPGQGAYRAGAMGWAHPWFRPSGGGHGGEGITFLEGLRALASGAPGELRRLRLLHRANTSRQPTGAWRANGSTTHLEEWLNEDGELPFAYHMKANAHHKALRLPCEGGPIIDEGISIHLRTERRPPYDQSDAIERGGKRPTNAADILAWHPHDGAHLIRYTAHAKALAWLSNDSLAIDSILHEAERFRFALPNTPSKAPPRITLHQLNSFANEQPAHGLPVGRELGWALDTVSAAFALGDDETRSRLIPWVREACAIVVKGTPSTGITTRNDHAPLSVPRTHAIAHTFQTAILQLGLRSARRSCLGDADAELSAELERLFMSCVGTLYFGQIFERGPKPLEVWPATGSPSGPRWIFPVAPLDWKEPPLTHQSALPASGFDGGVETAYSNTMLSWAHSLHQKSLNPTSKYRDRILDLGPRYKSWSDWVEHLARRSRGRSGLDMLSQAAPAILLAERQ